MSGVQVLLVAGTHGNEINAPWLFDQWDQNDDLIQTSGVNVLRVIGNPASREKCTRYLDRDLNRSFSSELIESDYAGDRESQRAKELLNLYGTLGENPCQIALDFHSTTSSMGSCLVIYGRRPEDLALASLIQFRLGLPIYLHEGDKCQNGFLVERWPCGLVIEIGPVAQALLHTRIVLQIKLILEVFLEEISKIRSDENSFPEEIIIHRHLRNLDFPRDLQGSPNYFIHNQIQDKDWQPIQFGDPLFQSLDNQIVRASKENSYTPVFINEAAYLEKNIAMGLTSKETWRLEEQWKFALRDLIIN
ncbi:aspartoacylase [Prochlorococcus sp. MIT 1223]|uniref:aspartoacylase n=1 Tax=Prochlorococcus sp. MIT 1223 TaxID=3096217 RepID=UPI002A7550FC|nr:aspartoacylase [Prochlorococcus sp. MIT 1223]